MPVAKLLTMTTSYCKKNDASKINKSKHSIPPSTDYEDVPSIKEARRPYYARTSTSTHHWVGKVTGWFVEFIHFRSLAVNASINFLGCLVFQRTSIHLRQLPSIPSSSGDDSCTRRCCHPTSGSFCSRRLSRSGSQQFPKTTSIESKWMGNAPRISFATLSSRRKSWDTTTTPPVKALIAYMINQ